MKKSYKRIIETAETLFYRDGCGHVGVDTIRDESGCSKTTLYTHFGSKENLIAEVLKYRDLKFRESLLTDIGENTSGFEAIVTIFEGHRKGFTQESFNGCLFIRAAAEFHDEHAKIVDIVLVHKEWIRNFIHQKIEQYPDAQDKADQVFIILEGLISVHTIYKTDKIRCDAFMAHSREMIRLLFIDP